MTIFTIELVTLYYSEYEVRIWFGTCDTSRKPTCILNFKDRERAVHSFEAIDTLLKAIDNFKEEEDE